MSALNTITSEKLMKLVGPPAAPIIIDVRNAEDFDADPRLLPAAVRRSHGDAAAWVGGYRGKSVAAVCHHGAKLSHGAAAWLRHAGADAVLLEDGFEGWKAAGLPLVPVAKLPQCDAQGRRGTFHLGDNRSGRRFTGKMLQAESRRPLLRIRSARESFH